LALIAISYDGGIPSLAINGVNYEGSGLVYVPAAGKQFSLGWDVANSGSDTDFYRGGMLGVGYFNLSGIGAALGICNVQQLLGVFQQGYIPEGAYDGVLAGAKPTLAWRTAFENDGTHPPTPIPLALHAQVAAESWRSYIGTLTLSRVGSSAMFVTPRFAPVYTR
jgi:hypothetical protein